MKKTKWGLIGVVLLCAVGAILYTPDRSVDELKAQYSYPESKFIAVDGMNVHYRETGSADKPTVLMMHGVASSLHTWEGWQKQLSNDFHVISIDVPSFGLTGPFPSDAPLTTAKFMQFIDDFTAALHVSKLSVVGNSFGGYLAWNYALHAPDRVEKLIISDGAGLSADVGTHDPTALENNVGFFLTRNRWTQYSTWYVTPRALVFHSSAAMYGDPTRLKPEVQQRYYDLLRRTGVRHAFSKVLQMPELAQKNSEQVAKIKAPTLIIWGANDNVLLPSEGQLFHKLIANSQYIEYSGVGHLPMEEIPEKSGADAKAFLLSTQ